MSVYGAVLAHPFARSSVKSINRLIKECNPLLATDPKIITAQDGRPVPQGQHILFNGTTHSITAPHLAGTETVVSSFGTSVPTVAAGTISFTAGTCAILLLSDGTLYDMQERNGPVVKDSSGAENNGTFVNNPPRVNDNTLSPDPANERGFTELPYFDGNSEVLLDSEIEFTGAFTFSMTVSGIVLNLRKALLGHTSNSSSFRIHTGFSFVSIFNQAGGSINISPDSTPDFTKDVRVTIERDGSNIIYLSIDGVQQVDTMSLSGDISFDRLGDDSNGSYPYIGSLIDIDLDGQHQYAGISHDPWVDNQGSNNGTASNMGDSTIILARADNPLLDVQGNVTQWPGIGYAHDWELIDSYSRSFNGTTQHVLFPSLTGSETVVSSFGTSTPSIVAGQINFTAGWCAGLVLSNGLIIPMADKLSTCYSTTSGVSGTYVNAPPLFLQGDYHFNITFGVSTTGGDFIPADKDDNGLDVDGDPLTNPAIADGHNAVETLLDFNTADDGDMPPAIHLASPTLPETYAFGDPQTENFRFRVLDDGKGVDRLLAFAGLPNAECTRALDRYGVKGIATFPAVFPIEL